MAAAPSSLQRHAASACPAPSGSVAVQTGHGTRARVCVCRVHLTYSEHTSWQDNGEPTVSDACSRSIIPILQAN